MRYQFATNLLRSLNSFLSIVPVCRYTINRLLITIIIIIDSTVDGNDDNDDDDDDDDNKNNDDYDDINGSKITKELVDKNDEDIILVIFSRAIAKL